VPMFIAPTAGGQSYANPLVGLARDMAHVKLDTSGMTTAEVDADGYLKPGVLLTKLGILVGAGPAFPFGVVVEAQKVTTVTPVTTATLAAETADPLVAVCTNGLVNRDVAEDDMGRAYNANEIASFDLAGSKLHLTTT
jgi:hypothetical protein